MFNAVRTATAMRGEDQWLEKASVLVELECSNHSRKLASLSISPLTCRSHSASPRTHFYWAITASFMLSTNPEPGISWNFHSYTGRVMHVPKKEDPRQFVSEFSRVRCAKLPSQVRLFRELRLVPCILATRFRTHCLLKVGVRWLFSQLP